MSTTWSLEELAAESQKYLLDDGDSRRVQWKPNGRQIRYYSTLGLLDKPDTENGRTVWYGPKHLLQLLAIKKLQQEGMKLADIQRALAGASPEQIRRLVGLPQSFLAQLHNSVKAQPAPRRRTAFWAERPVAPPAQAGAGFVPCMKLEIAPGVSLTLDEKQAASLGDREREALARALHEVWRQLQEKRTKENP
jgi:DNA-binding transcriptional MerR regulator